MFGKEWILPTYNVHDVHNLSKSLNVSPILAKLLINRGYKHTEEAQSFLKKDINDFHSPFLMKDIEKGASLFIEAIKNKKKILVWGDYDVDGVTSVTTLVKYIKSINGICDYYIPKRDDDGYGLNSKVIDEYIANGTSLLITVDSGITAINEIKSAKEKDIVVIVTDHHECRDVLPSCDAVINPKRPDCSYPYKELAGVGVVFKFICAAEMIRTNCSHLEAVNKLLNKYAEFVAIGTIADVMPISDENRLIVNKGLSAIQTTGNIGLMALLEESGFENAAAKKKKVSSTTVGFVLAPRINAAGRMDTSKIAVELFMTESREQAAMLAAKLSEINKERQVLENENLLSALEKVNTQCDLKNDKVLVLSDDNWHHGIIGIVSSRITEKYNLPSVLISFKNEIQNSDPEIGKGSARSIKGMNLVKSLSNCSDLLTKFGGHELAAGLSIKRSNLDEFRKRINEYAKEVLKDVNLSKTLSIDCELLAHDITIELANELTKLEPFGLSNSVPTFSITDVKIKSVIAIGDGKHTKLLLRKNNENLIALCFGTPTSTFKYMEGDSIDVAFNIDVNNFKNQQTVQLIIRDIKPSKIERDIIKQHIFTYEKVLGNNPEVKEHDIPTRNEFALVYTTIRDTLLSCGEECEKYELYLPYFVKLISKRYSGPFPMYKAMIILDVLVETNLILIEDIHSNIQMTLNVPYMRNQRNKVLLEEAPTMKKLYSKLNV